MFVTCFGLCMGSLPALFDTKMDFVSIGFRREPKAWTGGRLRLNSKSMQTDFLTLGL